MAIKQDSIVTVEVSAEEILRIDSLLENAAGIPGRPTDTYAAVFCRSGLKTGDSYAGYEIGPVIGNGGIAEVRLARHIDSGEKRAIKYPKQDMLGIYGKVLEDAFIREAELLQNIDHPNIVRGYEPFEYKGVLHIPLEYLEHDISDYFGSSPGMGRLCDFMQQAVRPLTRLHEMRLVHCDIKPNQYLVDSRGTIKLTDFGSVRLEGEEASNEMMMTPTYFPLKIINRPKMRFSHSIDLYAFGKSIARMLLSTLGMPKDEISELTRRGDDHECIEMLRKADVPKYLINNIINSCLLSVDENSNFNAFDLEGRIDTFRQSEGFTGDCGLPAIREKKELVQHAKETVSIRRGCAIIIDRPHEDD